MGGAPEQGVSLPPGTDLSKETGLAGKVVAGGQPVGGAFVRLLDGTGEFTAEVVASPAGEFRFYAAPGTWTVRVLSRSGTGQAEVSAPGPGVHRVDVAVA